MATRLGTVASRSGAKHGERLEPIGERRTGVVAREQALIVLPERNVMCVGCSFDAGENLLPPFKSLLQISQEAHPRRIVASTPCNAAGLFSSASCGAASSRRLPLPP